MILIRADANEKIGTGHVMRCLSIAREFVVSGHKVLFVTADHKGDRLISTAGFNSICMDSTWSEMEQEPILDILFTYHPNLLIVDSYFVTEKYFEALSRITRVAYIDDLNTTTWDVDYLINYNIYGDVLDYSSYLSTRTILLLGPAYVPLRPEFQSISKHIIKPVSDVMISAGGSDPEGITERLMITLCPQWTDIRFHFIVGTLNPRIGNIKALVTNNIILHIDEKDMAGLMQICDIAISAAGTTLYELCAMGIPTIMYTLADNQIFAAKEFEGQGIMCNAGDCRNDEEFAERMGNIFGKLICDKSLRMDLSMKMQKLVDGRGAERIVKELL